MLHDSFTKMMKKTSTIKIIYVAFWAMNLLSIIWMPIPAFAQANKQRDLLERAYDTKSYDLLEQFFDNWQKEYADNEAEAPDKWVAEAHKVFTAICSLEFASHNGLDIQDSILVVQSTLDKIGYVKGNSKYFQYGKLNETRYVMVDSALAFRPNPHLENHSIVYLTEDYRALLKDYVLTFSPLQIEETFDDWELTESDSILTIIGNEEEPYDEFKDRLDSQLDRAFFLRHYADATCLHFLSSNYTIVPFIIVEEITFDGSLQFAVVKYSECISGRTVVLRKKGNKWLFDHVK